MNLISKFFFKKKYCLYILLILTSSSFSENEELSLTHQNKLTENLSSHDFKLNVNITITPPRNSSKLQSPQAGFLNFKIKMHSNKNLHESVFNQFAQDNCAQFINQLNNTVQFSNSSKNVFYQKLKTNTAQLEKLTNGGLQKIDYGSYYNQTHSYFCIVRLKNDNEFVKDTSSLKVLFNNQHIKIIKNKVKFLEIFYARKNIHEKGRVDFKLSGLIKPQNRQNGVTVNVYNSKGVYQATDDYKKVFDLDVSLYSKQLQDYSKDIYLSQDMIPMKPYYLTDKNEHQTLYWQILNGQSGNLLNNVNMQNNQSYVVFRDNQKHNTLTFFVHAQPKSNYPYKNFLKTDAKYMVSSYKIQL